eukprot:GHVT01062502.1.p1 GENE.GHVT01062502.1~~GHVT01062502.1.p1  ORF type:complete len:517 (-),score=44.84 GHVT01062502.1:705-2147(-)
MAEPSFTNELTPRGSTPPAPSEQTVSLDSPQGGSANRDAKKPPAFLGLTVPWLALGVLTLLGGGALGKLILIDPPTSPARVSVISPQNLPAASSSEPKKTFLFPKGVPAEFSSPPQSSRPELGAGGTTPPAAAVAAASLSLFTPQEMDECLHRVGFNGSSTPTTGRPGALRRRRLDWLTGARAQKCLLLMTSFFILAYQAVIDISWVAADGSLYYLRGFHKRSSIVIDESSGEVTEVTLHANTCPATGTPPCVSPTTMAGYTCQVLSDDNQGSIQYCFNIGDSFAFIKGEKGNRYSFMKVASDYISSHDKSDVFEDKLHKWYPDHAKNHLYTCGNNSFTDLHTDLEGYVITQKIATTIVTIVTIEIVGRLLMELIDYLLKRMSDQGSRHQSKAKKKNKKKHIFGRSRGPPRIPMPKNQLKPPTPPGSGLQRVNPLISKSPKTYVKCRKAPETQTSSERSQNVDTSVHCKGNVVKRRDERG